MAEEGSTRLPQTDSTVAQSFAADLDSMFGLDSGTASLAQNVEEKKQNVTSGQSELEQLEAKLRATEQRLAKISRQNSPARQADTGASSGSSASQPPTKSSESAQRQSHPMSQRPTYPADRPPTQPRPGAERSETQEMMSNMPGAMPSTPPQQSNGREDYVMVDNRRQR